VFIYFYLFILHCVLLFSQLSINATREHENIGGQLHFVKEALNTYNRTLSLKPGLYLAG